MEVRSTEKRCRSRNQVTTWRTQVAVRQSSGHRCRGEGGLGRVAVGSPVGTAAGEGRLGRAGQTRPYCACFRKTHVPTTRRRARLLKLPLVFLPRGEIWTHSYSEMPECPAPSRCLFRSLTWFHPFLQIRLNSRGLIYSVGLLLASVFVTVGLHFCPYS